jgi:preprotein translocase SecF subunit
LTIMGYSINDTIIIFDRIRENIIKAWNQSWKKQLNYAMIFEDSLRQTMRRSVGTSLSTFLVIVAMYVFGSGVIQSFALVMGIGILAGSFSSIFIAAPLAYYMILWNQSQTKTLKK